MQPIVIENGRILAEGRLLERAALCVRDGAIASIGRADAPKDALRIDAKGGYVLPGFIEAHAHGGGGCDFMDATPEAFRAICETFSRHGTTTLAPTTIACSYEAMRDLFQIYRQEAGSGTLPLTLAGIHLEGPYLSQRFRGAQPARHVRPPEPREIDCLLDEAGDILVRCSAAPELPGAREMARKMCLRGIRVALAHSDATCEQVMEAFDWGFTHITHLYSSTPSVHKVNQRVHAGVVEAAYLLDDMTVELIGDGRHVPKELLQVPLKIKDRDRVMLVTDAMRAAGTDVAESYLGAVCPENRVIIEDGVAKLPDRSFYAGSIATSDHMFRVMVGTYGLSVADACHAMCEVPARHLRLEARKGSIAPGKDADLVIVSPALELEYVLSQGRIVHAPLPIKEEMKTSCPCMLA